MLITNRENEKHALKKLQMEYCKIIFDICLMFHNINCYKWDVKRVVSVM